MSMTSKIIRLVPKHKADEKILDCRQAGMKIIDNKLSKVIKVYYGPDEVLVCSHISGDRYQLAFNSNYWEEKEVMADF